MHIRRHDFLLVGIGESALVIKNLKGALSFNPPKNQYIAIMLKSVHLLCMRFKLFIKNPIPLINKDLRISNNYSHSV